MTDSQPKSPAERVFLDELMKRRRVPLVTYRLQFTPAFTFDDAARIVPYLARLGITEIYCSPIFRAKPGSTHGYDVCDFGQLNPELGGDDAFARLQAALHTHGLGLVQDFVPNHMAVEPVQNPWWRNMLEHGPASPFANYFDVDWNPIKPELRGKVLLPFLGNHYGQVLENGELVVEYDAGCFVVRYFESTRPIDPRQYPRVLRIGLPELRAEMGDSSTLAEFLSIITALDHLPGVTDQNPERIGDRLRECAIAKERLARLVDSTPRIRQHINDALHILNGTPGQPESFDALHELLEELPFRLAYWKTAVHEINYRRFFDINQLAGLRVEEPAAFQAMHQLLLRLICDGTVTGVRLDHIDGLFDPMGYAQQLQSAVRGELLARFQTSHAEPELTVELQEAIRAAVLADPTGPVAHPLYVVVEKILTGDESLPTWQSEGTTGYDFLNDVSRLFVNSRNAQVMRQFYRLFTDRTDPFREVLYDCKKLITWTSLASELNVLAEALDRFSEVDRRTRDFTLDSLREALREVAVCFPVYRTYVGPGGITDTDRQVVDLAIQRARWKNPALETSAFDFVRANLVPELDASGGERYRARLRFAMKFQQYTGPLQAKGVEDTAFYRYNVLVSLNEVGGDPQRFGGTIAQFHSANQQRRARVPRAMLSTAIHDTKRGEDARTRIHVLSEVPRTWRGCVREWAEINAACRSTVDGTDAPDRNDEYLFYQTLVGCWPAEVTEPHTPPELVARVRDYMLKAIKEAKVHTSWITSNEGYDRATAKFVEEVLCGERSHEFLAKFLPFQRRVARAGMVNSLAQLVLKSTAPGVPDFYQGTELWDTSLVDPDNRRAVDYAQRMSMLAEIEPWLADTPTPTSAADAVAEWLNHWPDGRIKLYLTTCLLRLRKRAPQLFLDGEYLPLATDGEQAEHVVAFARRLGNEWAIAVVPRLSVLFARSMRELPVGDVWGNTVIQLPESFTAPALTNAFTRTNVATEPVQSGSQLRLSNILAICPVALLTSGVRAGSEV